MNWTRRSAGHYTNDNGHEIKREQCTGSFGDQFFSIWWVSFNGVTIYSGPTLTAAKALAEDHHTNPGACWTPNCRRVATASTPRAAVSLAGDGTIPTCDRCYRRYAPDAEMAARVESANAARQD